MNVRVTSGGLVRVDLGNGSYPSTLTMTQEEARELAIALNNHFARAKKAK